MAAKREFDETPVARRRMRISSRLVLLLAVPLVGLLAVSGFGMWSGATRSADADAIRDRTEFALVAYRLIEALEDERSALIGEGETTADQRAATESLTASLADRGDEIGGDVAVATEATLRRLSGAQLIAERGLGGRVAMDSISTAVDSLLDLAATSIDPAGAFDGAPASTVDYLARAQAASAEERDLVSVLADEGDVDPDEFQEVMALASVQASFTDLAAQAAPADLAVRIREVGFAISADDLVRRDALASPAGWSFARWTEGLEIRTDQLSALQGDAETLAVDAVDTFAERSRLLLITASLAAIAALIISILLLRRANLTIARPLKDLAGQAEDVAHTRLPEAVRAQQTSGTPLHLPALRATGAAEVHEVADAFNDVQDTALRLAGEQAALRMNQAEALTNLGRRNQTLLARQLDFISSLEDRETDPAFLEHLFKLDHLASRMRRNAESLLILAGSETPRRRRTPAPISEIVRAAMSEVEEFERVRIGHLRDATVAGPTVIDLVHLLAELIENALGFSPPDSTVEIEGRSLGQGGYQFAVIDHGVGMGDVELQAANERLGGTEELVGMPTRYLGQYVVAKLARKVGAAVRLQPSVGGRGVTAVVVLGSAAMVGAPDRDAVASPLPGSRASRERGPAPFAPGAGVTSDDGAPAPDPVPLVAEEAPVPASGGDAAPFEPIDLDTDHAPDPASPADPYVFDRDQPWDAEFADDRPVPSGDPSTADGPATLEDPTATAIEAVSVERPVHEERSDISEPFDPADAFTPAEPFTSAEPFTPEDASLSPAPPTPPDPFAVADPFAPVQETPAVDPLGAGEPDGPEAPPADAVPDWVSSEHDPASVDPADAWAAFTGPVDEPSDPAPWSEANPSEATSSEAPSPFGRVDPPLPSGPASSSPSPPPPPPPESSPHTEWSAPPAEPAAFGADLGPRADDGLGRSGGLARRVPGASLAGRPDDSGPAADPTDRSADAVRSMLSSFQAGRVRGRTIPADEAEPTTTEPDATAASAVTVEDGRTIQ